MSRRMKIPFLSRLFKSFFARNAIPALVSLDLANSSSRPFLFNNLPGGFSQQHHSSYYSTNHLTGKNTMTTSVSYNAASLLLDLSWFC